MNVKQTEPVWWRWIVLGAGVLALILIPFFVFGSQVDQWTRETLAGRLHRQLAPQPEPANTGTP